MSYTEPSMTIVSSTPSLHLALLDEYASKYGIKLNDGYWYCEELSVNPTDGEGLGDELPL